jgi:phosphoenolpyruvate carboxykinase (diphosphate)
MLRPELQDMSLFAASVDAIVESQRRVANNYFEDGSVEAACPPLKALLHIMAWGSYEGKGIDDPRIRAMFTRESLLASGWYRERLETKRERDIALWQRHLKTLEDFRAANEDGVFPGGMNLEDRLSAAQTQLSRVSADAYLEELVGTIGADPFHLQISNGKMP